ncbi:hypothetical protein [Sphingomonas sp.]|uniref:hypothetical protein n=1 Tax=Sphingomonas sp. TaxID=28214 RepID=UPI001ED3D4BB|nr:hypothetical protein [Sphingomonas sp.]MBX3594739.1 hypothetical protein [Sphingomonas sp.]
MLLMIATVILAAVTDAIVQSHLLAAGHGCVRGTIVSGIMGVLVAIAIIAAYFIIDHVIWRLGGGI